MAATITFLRIGNRVSAPICIRCGQRIRLYQAFPERRRYGDQNIESCGCGKVHRRTNGRVIHEFPTQEKARR